VPLKKEGVFRWKEKKMNSDEQIRLFDTHCHMDFDAFKGRVTEEFAIARQAGVEKFLIPGCGVFNWNKVEEIARSHKAVYFSMGLHPYFMEHHSEHHLELLHEKLLNRNKKCVAIGECGLDFYHSREKEEEQKKLFIEQIKLANQFQLPLILHSRKAHQETIKQLKRGNIAHGGVIHAFTGSFQQAMDYIHLGFYVGVGGAITYPRAEKTRNTISQLPLDSLVLETDSPDMPVFGHQGEKNRPGNLKIILNELNILRRESEQMIAAQVFKNSEILYSMTK